MHILTVRGLTFNVLLGESTYVTVETLRRAHFCCKFLPLGVSALMDFAYLFVTYETIKTFYFNSFQNVPISFVLRVKKTVFIISILLNNCDIWRSV